MKFLNIPELAALTNCISGRVVGDIVLDGRVEAYSCESIKIQRNSTNRRPFWMVNLDLGPLI